MFARQERAQAKKTSKEKPGQGDSALHGKTQPVQNSIWQLLALRPVTIHPKLSVSQPDDHGERETDRVAEQAMRLPPPVLQQHSIMLGRAVAVGKGQDRPDGGKVTRTQKSAQEQASKISSGAQATPSAAVAQARRGSRRPLPYRSELEDYFQRGLSNLEPYFGLEAAESCGAVRAQAFCAGNVLAFADPSPSFDVVAHEVAHSLQQGGDRENVSGIPSNLEVAPENSPAEREAANEARAAVRQRGTLSEHNSSLTGEVSQPKAGPPGIHTLRGQRNMQGVAPWNIMLARLPAPSDCHTRRRGLSGINPVVKETYDGTASTTIVDGWEMDSWERRWQIYDATDTLVWESFYTIPQPTLEIPKELITGGTSGGEQNPWSVWIKVTQTLVPFGGDNPENFPHDYTTFPVYETAQDYAAAQEAKAQTGGDDEWVVRLPGLMPQPPVAGVMTSAGTKVSPQVALELVKNMSKGEAPFRPELGKGGCSWFISEGNPYTGTAPAKNVSIQAEVARPAQPITFDEAKLQEINQKIKTQFEPQAEAQYRQHKGIPPEKPLNSKQRSGLARFIKEAVESRMWDEVGKQVRESGNKVGEVILQNSEFSKSGNGKFLVVADASKIQIKGGMASVVAALESAGTPVEPVVKQAAEAMASRMKWAGRVRNVFRYGGKVLIVVAVAADIYKVYVAQDKTKAVITSVGGWVGATVAGAAFAAWWTPADVAGPWAWAGHGVGTLIAGGVGYWVGSETVRTIYELVVEE